MAENSQLGVYWGKSVLYFTESRNSGAHHLFESSFTDHSNNIATEDPEAAKSAPQHKISFQHLLQKAKINVKNIHLSLPTDEIIFRTFTIPWMPSHEVPGVVEFEIGKYIPFSLELLKFAFHPITITEGDTKRIRIIFVAIKSDILNNYVSAINKNGVTVNRIEPSPLSIIRALTFKKLFNAEETIAILAGEGTSGKIVIVNGGIPHFVRGFNLQPSADEQGKDDHLAILAKLTNETRISLDYFSRQDSNLHVSRIVLLSLTHTADMARHIEFELEIPVIPVDLKSIFGELEAPSLNYINSFGCSLIDIVNAPLLLELSDKKVRIKRERQLAFKEAINIKHLASMITGCLLFVAATFYFTYKPIIDLKQKVSSLTQQLADFADRDTPTIEMQNSLMAESLKALQNFRLKSDISFFLNTIPSLLPDGTWIKTLDIIYIDPEVESDPNSNSDGRNSKSRVENTAMDQSSTEPFQLTLQIAGYSYLEDAKEQFKLVNKFLQNLKENKDFSNHFDIIKLVTVDARTVQDYNVTYFEVMCQ